MFLNIKQNLRIVKSRGAILLTTLVFMMIAGMIIAGLVGWFSTLIRAARELTDREQVFQIAEAGVEYYRWHLAHAPADFKDGKTTSGPYVHSYYDRYGIKLGSYSLDIVPPPSGSTIVTITSTGKLDLDPSVSRKIKVRMAMPSLAKFAVVADDVMRFGEGTEVYGEIQSNNGIRFDGIAHNLVVSSDYTYDDPDHTGNEEYAVHTHVNAPPATGINETFRASEAPPNALPVRSDVFLAGRQFSVPAFDFTSITQDLSDMKTKAQSSGRYFGSSGAEGYHIVLKTDDTYDVYRVDTQYKVNGACKNKATQDGWSQWSVGTETKIFSSLPFPSNSLIFFEDNVWVEGTINTAHLTIVSARFIDNQTNKNNILINNDIKYTNHDGQDALALIAQGNISVGLVSEDNLEIDAALIAQNGRVGRYFYDLSQCNGYDDRDTITLYGMLATNQRYGFSYIDSNTGVKTSGYTTRNITYDANLLYSPPPYIPLSSDYYSTISWEEVN
jgi:type II secretory pathway pseudopilin PulG